MSNQKGKKSDPVKVPAGLRPKAWYSTDAIARHFPISEAELRKRRSQQRPPSFMRLNRTIWYRPADVAAALNREAVVVEPRRL